MSFRLLIECTKDIDELSINFSDGTSTIVGGDDNSPKKHAKKTPPKKIKEQQKVESSAHKKEEYLDLDADFGGVSQDVVQKPVIDDKERPVKIADELQNMDF